MKKKDFIKKFNLQKGEKNYFWNGRSRIERIVYYDKEQNAYIFFENDLCGVDIKTHYIKACYSWYH